MARPSRLDDIAIATKLRGLPGWSRSGDAIARTFLFAGSCGFS